MNFAAFTHESIGSTRGSVPVDSLMLLKWKNNSFLTLAHFPLDDFDSRLENPRTIIEKKMHLEHVNTVGANFWTKSVMIIQYFRSESQDLDKFVLARSLSAVHPKTNVPQMMTASLWKCVSIYFILFTT